MNAYMMYCFTMLATMTTPIKRCVLISAVETLANLIIEVANKNCVYPSYENHKKQSRVGMFACKANSGPPRSNIPRNGRECNQILI